MGPANVHNAAIVKPTRERTPRNLNRLPPDIGRTLGILSARDSPELEE